SSGAGTDGKVGVTILSALLALGIAVLVLLRFVPRLARGVDWGWLPLASRYRITHPGWIYLGGIAVVIFAAVNTSNNLLYMVLSALLAVLLLSGFLSSLNLQSIQVQLHVPSRCFVGEQFQVSVRLINHKRLFPTFSLHVDPPKDTALRSPMLYFAVIQSQNHSSQSAHATFTRRGRYDLGAVRVAS